MDTLHKNSHIVYVRRLPQFASAAQKDLEEYFANSQRGYGSYFTKGSNRTATGLTPTEEDLLLPYILSIPKEDREFRKGVTNWFEGLSVKIPAGEGMKLEIGLNTSNTEPVSGDNLPININDYILYRHGVQHPWVAASEADGKGNQLKQYYIYDPNEVSKVNVSLNDERDEAMRYYLTIKDNARTVNQYLTLLGVRTNNLRKGEEVLELRKHVDKTPKKFIEVYKDKDKEMKYIIEEMINTNILERVNTRILVKETGDQIGRDMKEAILYLSDSKNTKVYGILKARLQEAWKKTSVSVNTDEDLLEPPVQRVPEVAVESTIPATEIIPAGAPETQEAEDGTAGAIDE